MTIVLLVEGETERRALPSFFKRWLDPKLARPAKIKAAQLRGSGGYKTRFASSARNFLSGGAAILGLLDWYESGLQLPPHLTLRDQYTWARDSLEKQVGSDRFRQHFALHETEAWLLSDQAILPSAVRSEIPKGIAPPEQVDLQNPPSKLLKSLYHRALSRPYKKIEDGVALFTKLDPELAASRCPHLRMLLNDLLELAREI